MTRATRAYHTGLLFFGYLAFYWLIQYLINSTEVDYFLSLDALFPFIPEFVWVYHTLPVGIFLVMVVCIKTRKLFMTTFWACMLAAIIMSFFHVFAPAFYPREAFEITNTHEWLVGLTRQIDGSNNTFPSGHVAFSALMYLSARSTDFCNKHRFTSFLFMAWAIGVSISTMAIKQHFFLDVVSGWLVAYASFYLCRAFIMRQATQRSI
jgi:membrane-associated phospholipid phosphatase